MHKFSYYVTHYLYVLVPKFLLHLRTRRNLQRQKSNAYIEDRVNYYCKVADSFEVTGDSKTSVKGFHKTGGNTYFLDLYKVISGFDVSNQFTYINGDVIHVPDSPSFLKSRPIAGDNQNSVLLKLNAIRHYLFVNDTLRYQDKKDMVVWKGAGFWANRRVLLNKYSGHPLCDITRSDFRKQTPDDNPSHFAPKMSIEDQLKYKFVLSLEGKDVATNLKWIMSSNSVCIMPKPEYETWFMEGRLEAGVHYIEVKDDFSDLLEKMDYYLANEEEALAIVRNANQWVEQFKDADREVLIAQHVANRYFKLSNQATI
ncbi:lipopolysaccharide A protein [Vibrio sp. 10N.286.49.B3]|uniref:glycosyl transferase family 90 n=1 Tax=Vibrio sp. 10N.286.49.B3 TaxID=1880855 RepID=UPI000C844FD7|nr:glycosyl transferase family 90 [Vibrio sp. 10N.286.49.B3]PMH45988.1 lipopolysaccharide A protein [Vibrio sp. 10N.286.49.B3]